MRSEWKARTIWQQLAAVTRWSAPGEQHSDEAYPVPGLVLCVAVQGYYFSVDGGSSFDQFSAFRSRTLCARMQSLGCGLLARFFHPFLFLLAPGHSRQQEREH